MAVNHLPPRPRWLHFAGSPRPLGQEPSNAPPPRDSRLDEVEVLSDEDALPIFPRAIARLGSIDELDLDAHEDDEEEEDPPTIAIHRDAALALGVARRRKPSRVPVVRFALPPSKPDSVTLFAARPASTVTTPAPRAPVSTVPLALPLPTVVVSLPTALVDMRPRMVQDARTTAHVAAQRAQPTMIIERPDREGGLPLWAWLVAGLIAGIISFNLAPQARGALFRTSARSADVADPRAH